MDNTKIKQIISIFEKICDIKFSNELSTLEHIKSNVLRDKTVIQFYNDLFKDFELKLEELKKEYYQKSIFELLLIQINSKSTLVETKYSQLNVNSSSYELLKESDYFKSGRFSFFRELHKKQFQTISRIKKKLKEEIELFITFSNETTPVYKANNEIEAQNLTLSVKEKSTPSRIVFSTSKKETLIFLYVLEQSGVITFESEQHRRSFIEEHLSYTEIRNNPDKGKHFPMNDVASDISKLKDFTNSKSNNRILEKLNTKLSEILDSYIFKK